MFVGPHGLRAGWRFAIFAALTQALVLAMRVAMHRWMHHTGDATRFFVREVGDIAILVLVSALMGRYERRSLADYGLPRGTVLRPRFWRGALLGLASLSALLGALAACGTFRIDGRALSGGAIVTWALVYALVFLLVGVREEFRTRGYALYTLTTGIGFWPAAVLSAAYFSYMHFDNAGENPIGLLNVGLYGLFACLLLRRTGDLAMPIGFHAAFDWGETYLYGVANSGRTTPGHLLASTTHGAAWLSGGSAGPEGSVLCTALLALLTFACARWVPETRYPRATALEAPMGASAAPIP